MWILDGSKVAGCGVLAYPCCKFLNRFTRFALYIRSKLESFPHDKSFGVKLAFHETHNVLHGERINVLGWRLLSGQGAKELVCSGCLVGQENLSYLYQWNGVGSDESVKPGTVILPQL